MSQLTATEKLFGTTTLDERQAAMARKTYALLGLSAMTAVGGGYLGATTPAVVHLFASVPGWIFAMIMINLVPRIALWASRRNQGLALFALGMDGFLSGLVLAPILFVASRFDESIVPAAGGVTLSVFVAVTGYVMASRRRFSAPAGLFTGMFVSIMAAITLNMFLNIGLFGMLISAAIGMMGVFMLVYATSDVLNNPDYDNPIQGALMLFAALFNIFVSILNLILRVLSGGRD